MFHLNKLQTLLMSSGFTSQWCASVTGLILGVDKLHLHLGSGAWKSYNSFRLTNLHPLLATGAIGLTVLAPETLGMISSG